MLFQPQRLHRGALALVVAGGGALAAGTATLVALVTLPASPCDTDAGGGVALLFLAAALLLGVAGVVCEIVAFATRGRGSVERRRAAQAVWLSALGVVLFLVGFFAVVAGHICWQ